MDRQPVGNMRKAIVATVHIEPNDTMVEVVSRLVGSKKRTEKKLTRTARDGSGGGEGAVVRFQTKYAAAVRVGPSLQPTIHQGKLK